MSKKLTDQKLREWEGFVNAQMGLLKDYSMRVHQRCLNKLVELQEGKLLGSDKLLNKFKENNE